MRTALTIVPLAVSIVAGALADRLVARDPMNVGGYRVLQADFHTHSSTWSDGALTPIGMVLEARARRLDAFAISGHNQIADSYVGHWFSGVIGGPIVLRGQEVLSPTHHIIAVGITNVVDYLQNAADTIAAIHRQGGIAIAAHPDYSTNDYDATALATLDGAEICHPIGYLYPQTQREFAEFRTRGPFAAIGSSDFHGMGQMGMCRTYVFAREASEAGILEAVRARRTVVYAAGGAVYGDPALVQLAVADGRFGESLPPTFRSPMEWVSAVLALAGLAALLTRRPRQRAAA
jgi:predicted metal-dependent phosphoesterase TrpH